MDSLKFRLETVFGGCNSEPHCLDVIGSLAIYACFNNIIIYDMSSLECIAVISNQKEAIKFLKCSVDALRTESLLILFSSASSAYLCSFSLVSHAATFNEERPVLVRGSSISAGDFLLASRRAVVVIADGDDLIFSACNTPTAGLLENWNTVQTFNTGKPVLAVSLCFCFAGGVLLAVAGVDNKISLFHLALHDSYPKPGDGSEFDSAPFETGRGFELVFCVKAHDDWIKDLSFLKEPAFDPSGETMYLASGSQDGTVAVWKVSALIPVKSSLEYFQVAKSMFRVGAKEFCLKCEGYLKGHAKWVSSVRWVVGCLEGNMANPPCLVSSSIDNKIVIWEKCNDEWIMRLCLEDGGKRNIGFYSALMTGTNLVANSKCGALYRWRFDATRSELEPAVILSGHSSAVNDAKWDRLGYLVTCSEDRTVRVFDHLTPSCSGTALTQVEEEDLLERIDSQALSPEERLGRKGCDGGNGFWAEISRAQVHGHAVQHVEILKKLPFTYASCSHERAVRVFTAPLKFTSFFRDESGECSDAISGRAETAEYSELNLCNKGVYGRLEDKIRHKFERKKSFRSLIEAKLSGKTLWPEVQKLFVDRKNVTAMANNSEFFVVASESCGLSHKSEVAFWHISSDFNWKKIGVAIECHDMAITQLRFSPSGLFLISVSRDRGLCVFRRRGETAGCHYELCSTKKNAHSRSVTCCEWCGEDLFLTGSVDNKIKFWRFGDKLIVFEAFSLKLSGAVLSLSAINASAFDKENKEGPASFVIAAGLKTGHIELYKFTVGFESAGQKLAVSNRVLRHNGEVRGLDWRDWAEEKDRKERRRNLVRLASCGGDHLVKIFGLE